MIASVRESFFQHTIQKFGNDIEAGLILGMTIGDRSMIVKERYDQFISSGLVHLIAVSGGNIAIVVLFVGMMLFRVPFYLRQVILIGAVILYASIVGGDSSIVRATLMGLLTLIALLPGRQISIWRSMAIARYAMLLRNPYFLVYDL
jgi:competence protein ComEC